MQHSHSRSCWFYYAAANAWLQSLKIVQILLRQYILFKRNTTLSLMYFILSQANLELFKLLQSEEFSTPYNPHWEGSEHPHKPSAQFLWLDNFKFLISTHTVVISMLVLVNGSWSCFSCSCGTVLCRINLLESFFICITLKGNNLYQGFIQAVLMFVLWKKIEFHKLESDR